MSATKPPSGQKQRLSVADMPVPAVAKKKGLGPAGVSPGKKVVDISYLIEKYGAKRQFLLPEEKEPPDEDVIPVGFVIKFRLSDAYNALQKQEVEASLPNLKPYRRRRPRFSITQSGDTTNERGGGKNPKQKALDQIKAKNQDKLLWKNLAKKKASESYKTGEKIQRAVKSSTKQSESKGGSTPNKVGKGHSTSDVGSRKSKQEALSTLVSRESVRFEDEVGMSQKERIQRRTVDEKRTRPTPKPTGSRLFRTLLDQGYQGHSRLPGETDSSSYDDFHSSSADTMMRMLNGGSSLRSGSITMETFSDEGSLASSARRRQSASAPPGGRSMNQSQQSAIYPHGSSKKVEVLGKHSGKQQEEEEITEGKHARRISKYLYHMCNCRQISKPDTLARLCKKRQRVSDF